MHKTKFLSAAVALMLLLLLSLGLRAQLPLSLAQGPEQPGGARSNAPVRPNALIGTAFTYQGRLIDTGTPVDDACDFQFGLWDDPVTGTLVAGPLDQMGVSLVDGRFTVRLDFGQAFTGTARWLEVAVQCPGDAGYTTLSPRQGLTPSPYALALPGLWTEQNDTSPNLIGGYGGNSVGVGVVGATIGGGGSPDDGFGNPVPNRVTGAFGTVGGGLDNVVRDAGATIGGGSSNVAIGTGATIGGGSDNETGDQHATIAGGNDNLADGSFATVGGGYNNVVTNTVATIAGGWMNRAGGGYAIVAGGFQNTASANYAAVGGGMNNTASGYAATVAGGERNTASGGNAAVGGGVRNTASGDYAMVPGGVDSTAQGDFSFAAGRSAEANNQGCFVWGDSTFDDITCDVNDRWVARASGGVYFYTWWNLSTGAYLATGSGTWASVSDRDVKENLAPVDGQEVLALLAEIPISTWNYKTQDDAIRHMGPMSQDFYAAFGLGEGERHITTIDADGVALAAIQGLYAQNQALAAENAALRGQLDDLEGRVAALEATVAGGTASIPSWQSALLPGAGLLLAAVGVVLSVSKGLTWVVRRGGER